MPEFAEIEIATDAGGGGSVDLPHPSDSSHDHGLDETVFSAQIRNLPRVELCWKDITLDVKVPGEGFKRSTTKRVLHGVSGYAKPGEFLAILGSTGAGKTSLINVLARRAEGTAHGTVLVNGQPVKDIKFAG